MRSPLQATTASSDCPVATMGPRPRCIPVPHDAFQRLAELPDLGRDASHIRPGYRKIETVSRSVFHRKTNDGVLIVRILHQRMDFDRHL
jgi:plasmid stabilization system protein ParE